MSGTYRYTGTTWYRNGETVTAGDVVEPTETELSSFGDSLEPVSDDGGSDDQAEPADAGGDGDDGSGDSYECGAETSSDGTCSRPVSSPEDRCHMHAEG